MVQFELFLLYCMTCFLKKTWGRAEDEEVTNFLVHNFHQAIVWRKPLFAGHFTLPLSRYKVERLFQLFFFHYEEPFEILFGKKYKSC